MLNRLRAAIACLRGRPVIAHCKFYEDDEPDPEGTLEEIEAALANGRPVRVVTSRDEYEDALKTTRSAGIAVGSVRGLTIIGNTLTSR